MSDYLRVFLGPFHVLEAECSRVVCSAVDVSELLLMVESEETGRD